MMQKQLACELQRNIKVGLVQLHVMSLVKVIITKNVTSKGKQKFVNTGILLKGTNINNKLL